MSRSSIESARDAVRIHVSWGDTLLEVFELSPPRAFFIGDGAESKLPVDLTIPGASGVRLPLVTVEGGEPRVQVPFGASATRRALKKSESERERATGALEREIVTNEATFDASTAIDVAVGNVTLTVTRGDREARAPRAYTDGDARPLAFFGLALSLSGAFLGSLAYFTPPLGLTDDEDMDRSRMYLMQSYLDASAERERKLEPADSGEKSGGENAAKPEDTPKGAAGKMGKPEVTAQNRRASGTNPGPEPKPATRAEERAMAENFGLIGMLNSGIAGVTPAPWNDNGVGNLAVAGGLFGTEIGESGGVNGLTLSGLEEGGGGHSDQIALASIGTCVGEACKHGLSGFGPGGNRPGGEHVARAFQVRPAGETVVGGSLPAEVIQRVVRQSFGRFRACYENALRTNPNLEGRVTARFVIARDGSVATVQSAGTDLPNSGVVACVLHTYGSLSFPAPKDGIVRVSYPLMFSPSA